MFEDADLPALIRARLLNERVGFAAGEPYPADYFRAPPSPAAVLMPLISRSDGWHLLFIRRASNDRDRHSGQVAFPGGRVDPGDASCEAAALREAEEEIGLAPANVDVLGRMAMSRTLSNYGVTPVIGHVLQDFEPRPEPSEVARVFSIPLRWLADPAHRECRPQRLPGSEVVIERIEYVPYDGEVLWGLSARLVARFLDCLG